MKNKKIARRVIPVNVFDVPVFESYLTDMAAKGFFLKKFGKIFAHYTKGEDCSLNYRLEPISKEGESAPSDQMIDFYESFGWSYVTTYNRIFHIFSSAQDLQAEVHTDPIVQALTFKKLAKKMNFTSLLVSGLYLISFALMLSIYVFSNAPVLLIVKDNQIIMQIIIFLLSVFVIFRTSFDAFYVNRLIKSLESGVPMTHKRQYALYRVLSFFGYSLLGVALFLIILLPIQASKDYALNQALSSLLAPAMVTLEEIEKSPNFVYDDSEDYVKTSTSFFAPSQYTLSVRGIVPGKMWADNSGEYSPSLSTAYFKLRFKLMGNPLLDNLITRYIYDIDNTTFKEPQDTGFDKVVIANRNGNQILFAHLGTEVIMISYYGEKNLETHLDTIYKNLAK